MNRYFHSWECQKCGELGCVEVFGLVTELPKNIVCDSCGNKEISKMSNHLNNQPTPEHLQMVKALRVLRGS